MGGFHFDCAGEGVGIGGDGADAFLEIVVEEVGAQLEVEAVGGQACHREEEDYRNDGDENVGDDQAIAEGPHEAIAEPGDQADEEIDGGEEGQEG